MRWRPGVTPFISPFLATQRHSTNMRTVVDSAQISLPVEVRPEEVMRKQSLGAAIDLCLELIDKPEKELQSDLGVDKGQFSRRKSGQEGIVWGKFVRLMDTCGNDAPLLWMLHQRGYDLFSLRKRETETERENRLLREENAALRRVLSGSAA